MEFEFSEEEKILRQQVRKFAREKIEPLTAKVEETENVGPQLVKMMGEQGLYTMFVPEEYGGIGLKVVRICIVREELCKVSSQADMAFTYGGLGTYGITYAGNEQQKKKYLPRVVKGEMVGAFALTEPDAGSDVAAMRCTARLDGDHYILNGEKIFITFSDVAGFWLTFAKTDPSKGRKGISLFIIDHPTPGVEMKRFPIIAGLPEISLVFTDCKVPRENLVGAEGDGWDIALGATLNTFRVTVGAAALGMAEAAFEEAYKYAQKRIAFGQPIINNQAIQFKLADMATEIEAARWLVYRAAYLRDKGTPRTIKNASMAKLFATEVASRVTDEAIQIHGGYGLCKEYKVERLFREARMARIYEGTSEIQRLTIARELIRRGIEE
ncbi:MAG: acyl-CoA dehydrogenase family protein [Deltaproteobacteria bacterium]|nr:acyl-CoA dehydrogenase family protein [Deltaproteobacteria bacterium]